MTGVSIIIPTYNESENLPVLVNKISSTLNIEDLGYEIIVVDDDSPDRTWEVAKNLGKQFPVRVLRRKQRNGLASAVVDGISVSDYDLIVVMDGDLQHPPGRIPDLLFPLLRGHDITIGSRFASGGSPGDFALIRLLTTYIANFIARLLFSNIRKINDIQSGFFGLKKSVTKECDLNPVGYKILLEILVKSDHAKVLEVGYEFRQREGGNSNMSIKTILNYLFHVARLKKYQIIKCSRNHL